MKKLATLLAIVMLATTFVGCGTSSNTTDKGNDNVSVLSSASPENFGQSGTTLQLKQNGYRLDFVQANDGYSINVVVDQTNAVKFSVDTPLKVYVKTSAGENYTEEQKTAKYSLVTKQNYGYSCVGYVQSTNGSVYRFNDDYYINTGINNKEFAVERTVKVLSSAVGDYGFESEYHVINKLTNPSINSFDVFMPAYIHGDMKGSGHNTGNDYTPNGETNNRYLYVPQYNHQTWVRETGMGLPLVSIRSKTSNDYISLQHLNPEISSIRGGGDNGYVGNNVQFGSIGPSYLDSAKTAGMSYVYPAREQGRYFGRSAGDTGLYDDANSNRINGSMCNLSPIARYTPNSIGSSHTYILSLQAGTAENVPTLITEAYKRAYCNENPSEVDDEYMVMDNILQDNIDLFSAEYKSFGTDGTPAAGVPFSINMRDKNVNEGYSFCNGFVGQQIPIGYQMYRFGIENGDSTVKSKGETMLNFWSSSKIVPSTGFAAYKWTAGYNATGGEIAREVTDGGRYYMRYIVDGAEGMLDAYRFAKQQGVEKTAWKNAALRNADVLCDAQNDDGSFWRTYNQNGTQYQLNGTESSHEVGMTSFGMKDSTYIPVRYLYKCYELTGDVKYKDAADAAIRFVYDNYYERGYYMLGAADVYGIDKESACFALYGYTAAYMLTDDSDIYKEKFKQAMEHAAVLVMSYTYAYDFAVPNKADNSIEAKFNPFTDGGVKGFSRISAGNHSADNFSAYACYEMYKAYLLTDGDDFYYSAAMLLQNATKSSSDYKGTMGYAYKAFAIEATDVSYFSLDRQSGYYVTAPVNSTAAAWLPWSSIANIEPLVNTKWTFGTLDIREISNSVAVQKQTLMSYGAGGKI